MAKIKDTITKLDKPKVSRTGIHAKTKVSKQLTDNNIPKKNKIEGISILLNACIIGLETGVF